MDHLMCARGSGGEGRKATNLESGKLDIIFPAANAFPYQNNEKAKTSELTPQIEKSGGSPGRL